MTLIAAGQNTRNRAMLGLQAMSQEEAEREALYQQAIQSEKAQRAQLAGTGLGLTGSYAVANPDKVTALGQKLGLLSSPAAEATITGNFAPITTAQMNSTVAGATKTGAEVAQVLGTPISSGGSTLSNASVMNAINAQAGQSAFLQSGAGLSATTPAAQAAVNASLANAGVSSAATGVGAGASGAGAGVGAGVGATTSGAASTAAAGATGATSTAAGGLAPLMGMAGPLAIGLGAFFLLNKLFD